MIKEDYTLELTQGTIEFLGSLGVEVSKDDLEEGELYIPINVTVTGASNSGIGSYQYGSENCNDVGELDVDDYDIDVAFLFFATNKTERNYEDKSTQLVDYILATDQKADDFFSDLADQDLNNYSK